MPKLYNPFLRRRRLRKETPDSTCSMHGEGQSLKAPFTVFESFSRADPSGQENEQDYLMEELELSLLAGSIIRRSRQLLDLHYLKTHPGQVNSTPPRKRAPQIVSSIDTNALRERILRKFEEEQIYLREGVTLSSVAREIDIDPHHLSRFLNLHLRTTFNGFVNSYRVNQAKALLARKPRESVLSIAFASGFNSKASFNRVFKRTTGTTPSEYRLKMKKA